MSKNDKEKKDGFAPKIVERQKSILCDLTEEEFSEHAKELAKLLYEQERIDARLASMRSAAKAEQDVVVAKIKQEQQLVQEMKEWRDIDCVIIYDYNMKLVTTKRKDTGEMIDSRCMRLDEMQIEIDLQADGTEGSAND